MRGVMRRPICIIGLTYVIVLLLYLHLNPYTEPSYGRYEGCTVMVTGQVEKKEHRISNGQEVLVVYLQNVRFPDSETINQDITNQSSRTASTKILNPNITNNTNDVNNIDNTNKTNKTNNTYGNMGVLCYMESEAEAEGEAELKIGSRVCIEGKFREFSHATNPGEFDAKAFYLIQNLCGRLQYAKVMEESKEYDRVKEGLYQIRQYFADLLKLSFAPKEASIMRAILLGEKSLLDDEVKMLYQLNGVIHILSISGLHISIIGMGIYKILSKFNIPKIIVITVSVILMYGYAIMTGMSVSANRAVVMFAFHITAQLWKRTYDMLTAMTIAAVCILLEQPLYLYHSGFLFSFGAVLAIGLLAPVIEENWMGSLRTGKKMSTNLAVSMVTLPVYLYFYYEYPVYSIFLNLLIIPGTSLLVADGFISIAGAAWKIGLGKCLAIPSQFILSFYELCCTCFLWLPGNRRITGQIAMWQIAIFAILFAFTILMQQKATKMQVWMWLLLALFCITLQGRQEFQITFLDVGQGDCIYVADGSGGHYLIDGGSSTKYETGTYQILPFLKAKGVNTLDAVYITHMDEDHYNGIEELLEQTGQSGVAIKRLLLPELCEKNQTPEYKEIVNLAVQNRIPVSSMKTGDCMKHGMLKLTCLYPDGCAQTEDGKSQCSHASLTTNESSMVLYLEYDKLCALFTGDLEGQGEEMVRRRIAERRITERRVAEGNDTEEKITLLKVAHHGSKNATSREFLETLNPDLSIISCGVDNRYGHPHKETLERLYAMESKVMSTAEWGAITVKEGKKIVIETFTGTFTGQ